MSDKQDRTGARTVADIERKYNFNKSFAEVAGIATDARTTAEKAKKAVIELDESLDAEEVFNRLTNNGKLQGLYRDEDGNLYVNATYIKSIKELLANNLTMTGTFTNTAEAFFEPGKEELETVKAHLQGEITIPDELIPLYDTTGSGTITLTDLANFNLAMLGKISLANLDFAKKTPITLTIDMSTPEKFIQYTGKNMWGRKISGYIGINFSSIRNTETEQRLENIETEVTNLSLMKTTLYTGTWNSGTIIVPNTDKYMLFRINMYGQGTSILAVRNGSHIRGVGGYSSDTPTVLTYHFAATVDGDIWSLVACNSGKPFEDSTLTNHTVTSIAGII